MNLVGCNRQLSLIVFISIITLSCGTFQTNLFIQNNLNNEEKAELIFQKGLQLYNTKLIEQNDLKAIPEVRSYFVAALRANPEHIKAQEYLVKTDTFKSTRLETYLSRAKTLKEKKTRTDGEDFELVMAIKQVQEIDNFNKEAIKLWFDTGEIRKQVLQRRIQRLAELDTSIRAIKNKAELNKKLVQVVKLEQEIIRIDPNNKDAETLKKSIDDYVVSIVLTDTKDAEKKLNQNKYQDAELAIINAEKTYGTLQKAPLPELSKVKYQLYFSWAASLYSQKKYQAAEARINTALQVQKTPEATDLKNKILKNTGMLTRAPAKQSATSKSNSTVPQRDYDAELPEVLVIIDATITRGDLVKAWDLVNANMVQIKIKSNKEKLAARKSTILDKVKDLYKDSIEAFNGEDYETARDGFRIIVRIDPGYEQAQAYLDRANTKLRALSGTE